MGRINVGRAERVTLKHCFQGVMLRPEDSPVVIEVSRQKDGQFSIYVSYDVDSPKRKEINLKDIFLCDIREIMKLALGRMIVEKKEDESDGDPEVIIIELKGPNKIEFI